MNSLIDVRELRTDFTNSLSNELFYSEGNGLFTGFNDVIDFNRIYRLMQNDYFDDTTNYSNQYQIYPKDYTDVKSLLKGNMQKCLYSINSKRILVLLLSKQKKLFLVGFISLSLQNIPQQLISSPINTIKLYL